MLTFDVALAVADKTETANTVVIDGWVYDMTDVSLSTSRQDARLDPAHPAFLQYIQNSGGIVSTPNGTSRPDDVNRQFMHDSVVSLFKTGAGTDITDDLESLNLDQDVLTAQKTCLRNLFFVGKVDNRGSAAVRRELVPEICRSSCRKGSGSRLSLHSVNFRDTSCWPSRFSWSPSSSSSASPTCYQTKGLQRQLAHASVP